MGTTCEVIGWLFVDSNEPRVLVREENGSVHLERTVLDAANPQIQTGRFRRGAPIIDPVTRETVGYEMEPVSTARTLC
ncbi:MAG TPA: hypothetical protein VF161_05105 [Steroidobacteraceae bacterium]|jgi:hypothetical protein